VELDTLRELYIDELRDLYSAEKQLVKALPKMAKNAKNPALRRAFLDHLSQTEGHVERLDEIFGTLDSTPGRKKCKGMEALIEEGEELVHEKPQEDVLDAGLISKAQRVEHYEMAGYGTVCAFARTLGENAHVRLLQKTLDEETRADKLLTQIAEQSINVVAARGESTSRSRGIGRSREREVTRSVSSEMRSPSRERATRERVGSARKRHISETRR